ncbi:hypothetical protein F6Y05_37680 [Bacillus megaterium]|nr:hypothetical protein [Priestia megaterium]
MKDIVKAILFGFIAICVVGLGFVGYYVYEVFLKETPVLTDRSKEQTASIKIVQTGEPSFLDQPRLELTTKKIMVTRIQKLAPFITMVGPLLQIIFQSSGKTKIM